MANGNAMVLFDRRGLVWRATHKGIRLAAHPCRTICGEFMRIIQRTNSELASLLEIEFTSDNSEVARIKRDGAEGAASVRRLRVGKARGRRRLPGCG